MLSTYVQPRFAAAPRPGEEDSAPVVIVGAGPVGLAAAIDCALHGLPVVVVDDDDTVSVGSRGVCYAKRTLEILDRLGVGDEVCAKGVSWNIGKTFFGDGEVFRFNLVPEPDHQRPGMVNLQQYHLEEILVRRCRELGVPIRWRHKVVALADEGSRVRLDVETVDGPYTLRADWVIAADGARSPLRRMLGLDVEGQVFRDRFLIADVVMKADFPAERWFWFDPPFHRQQSALLHKQADNVWRIDFQLGWDADPEEEKKPERVLPRIRAMLGAQLADERPFELEWVSVYTFQCRRMQRFRHGRVLFAGDAAHQVSPFGARGANSGIQDTDNLVWKLRLVQAGIAPEALLDNYSDERVAAADENILNSTRSTDFITPKSEVSRVFRDAVLDLGRTQPFARKLVNSGRLSVPCVLMDSTLNTPDGDEFAGWMMPGAPTDDAPVTTDGRVGWLLPLLGGRFQLLVYVDDAAWWSPIELPAASGLPAIEVIAITGTPNAVPGVRSAHDVHGRFVQRFDAQSGSAWLLRPDQHIVARWRTVDVDKVQAALWRALGRALAPADTAFAEVQTVE
jgi:3-(3-hydroxy-phenyl)propionate hydroxylase